MIDLDKKCKIGKCCICIFEKPCRNVGFCVNANFELACPKEIKIRLNKYRHMYTNKEKSLMLDILAQYTLGNIVEKEKEKRMETKTYEQGLEEAWEIASKIAARGVSEGGYSISDVDEIFGKDRPSFTDILRTINIHEVKAKIDAWEAEKNKPKLGDVVEIDDIGKFLFLGESKYRYHVLDLNDDGVPHMFEKSFVRKIKKTGKHFDIQWMLDEIG